MAKAVIEKMLFPTGFDRGELSLCHATTRHQGEAVEEVQVLAFHHRKELLTLTLDRF